MPLYRVTPGNGNRTDLNQVVDALSGQNDIGAIQTFQQISPPTALTAAINTTSGNLTGAYQYKVAFITGYWQGPTGIGTIYTQGNTGGGTASNTVSPNSQQINQSAIPIGPIGTVARAIYRTKANGSIFYFVTQISDNVTTSWTDNVSDTALVTVMPTTNTTGSYFLGDGKALNQFAAGTGHKHTNSPGDAPQIDSTGLANGAATDTVIGNRTVDDTATPNTGPSTITNLFSFFGKMIRQITGENSWITAPAMTIAAIVSALGSLSGLLTTVKTSLVSAINELYNTTPKKSTADKTYYVATTGSDSNDGSSGAPFLTIAKAISLIPQIVNHVYTINVAVGTYAEVLTIEGFSGKGGINIFGDANVVSTSRSIQNIVVTNCSITIAINGFNITSTTQVAMAINKCVAVTFAYMNVVAVAAFYGLISSYSKVYIATSAISNKSVALYARILGEISSDTNTGTGSSIGLLTEYGGMIAKYSTQPTGTTAESSSAGGVIR